MSAKNQKKRNLSASAIQPVLKRKRSEPKAQDETGVQNFLSPVTAFILQAGIEKLRMQIFKTQLVKFGGTLLDRLSSEVTHIIVDDKMVADRMCRLLKFDKPPDFGSIVKSSWLSDCFKHKKLIATEAYLLDLSMFDEKAEANKDDNPTAVTEEEQKKDNKSELPKVGFMFGHKKKIPNQAESDDDSDYVQSDVESEGSISEPEASSSASNTPSTSPKKPLPVSNENKYLLHSNYAKICASIYGMQVLIRLLPVWIRTMTLHSWIPSVVFFILASFFFF